MGRRRTTTTRRPAIYRRRRLPWWLIIIVAALIVASRYLPEHFEERGVAPPVEPSVADQEYVVRRVVDGDTLLLENRERVRLLGVDTPETVAPNRPVEPFGVAASEFTKRRIEGRRVRLGFDKERIDRYGRILAYVYADDGTMLNEELIRAGLSKAQIQYPYSNAMKRRFREAEAEARENERGLWSLAAEPRP
ncbi:MAG: thermonuclease family protein [Planctomycetota bacterium]|nr:thermonuclease family protein [Planctomycetaceae bacterium]MDQ3330794.1 thermonuclease family protein [Planctomycetota bacterium]